MHPLHVSKLVTGVVRKDGDIVELKKLGKGKVMVEFGSASAANNLVNSEVFKAYNLRAFTPAYKTSRRDVPQEMDEESIIGEISSPFKVTEVKRLTHTCGW